MSHMALGAGIGGVAAVAAMEGARRSGDPVVHRMSQMLVPAAMLGVAALSRTGLAGSARTAGLMVGVAGATPAWLGYQLLRDRFPGGWTGDEAQQVEGAQRAIGRARTFLASRGVTMSDVEVLPHNRFGAHYGPSTGWVNDAIYLGHGFRGERILAEEIVLHEYGHKLTRELNPKVSFRDGGEVGSIRESLADTFAAAVTGDWIIGEALTPRGLRSMADPPSAPPPGSAVTPPDHRTDHRTGDIHVDAGIPNKAAFLIGSELGMPAMIDIYVAATRKLPAQPGFGDLAAAVRLATAELHGKESDQFEVADRAWQRVGY